MISAASQSTKGNCRGQSPRSQRRRVLEKTLPRSRYRRVIPRGYQRSMFGGTPEEKPEAHRKASPITYAENIQAPILVLQGENDTRCPARQMKVYETRLKELGKSIEIAWFDAGHGSLAIDEQIKHQELMLRFACRVLG